VTLSSSDCLDLPFVTEAIARGFIVVDSDRITYKLHREREESWTDPEEWVRCAVVAFLIIERSYSPNRIDTEVPVPRRVPGDFADVVLFKDARCQEPFLVVETKADGQSAAGRNQAIEQAVGNAHSLRAPYVLYDEWSQSRLLDTSGAYPAMEREQNHRGGRDRVPSQYSVRQPTYPFIAHSDGSDIAPVGAKKLENKVRRTHSLIWAGGRRDPLTAFDEWSKLLFAKVHDERTTPNAYPRRFQVGSGETATAIANRIHQLFAEAADADRTIFPEGMRIALPDDKIRDIVETLQDISIIDTNIDTIGHAFERFFGSVFRGELGQYFTMRQLARFTVAALDIDHTHYVIDPTAGSGGFLLEALMQGWHRIEHDFAGQSEMERKRYDFAQHHVYGIEVHEVLARILKINLLLHHDGHTNIEADRSCLDTEFINTKLRTSWRGGFHRVVGNPPFGDIVRRGDRDLLGANQLEVFKAATDRTQVPSEHVIVERAIDMLKEGGRLGLVVPDGLFNNQGEQSNCPAVRRLLASSGVIEAIVSLPDYAFRKSGAQNKTSILFFRKYTSVERTRFQSAYRSAEAKHLNENLCIAAGLRELAQWVFLAEANHIGYLATGQKSDKNDLYNEDAGGFVDTNQASSILGELRVFQVGPENYTPHRMPDCMAMPIADMWENHPSNRIDPKYHLFKLDELSAAPPGCVSLPIKKVMKRRQDQVRPEEHPDDPVVVLTVSQSGDLRAREAGKGRTPPEWLGMYFEDMPTRWYRSRDGDVVFSGIDLWKGCIAVVPATFDGALVSSEFPVYEITDERLDPDFLSTLLRSRYYRRAFRAITTGHSNRRRTQVEDFEELEITFPPDKETQRALVKDVVEARTQLHGASEALHKALLAFSDLIDGRGDEVLVEVDDASE
jgi:type I restriction enzyme M protein